LPANFECAPRIKVARPNSRDLDLPARRSSEDPVMKPVMNIDEIKFDDVEENGLYTSSRGRI
jgi:hypothetical protein